MFLMYSGLRIDSKRKQMLKKHDINIADYDAELWQAMEQEVMRQKEHIELIASEIH